jgi:hypothetical protein
MNAGRLRSTFDEPALDVGGAVQVAKRWQEQDGAPGLAKRGEERIARLCATPSDLAQHGTERLRHGQEIEPPVPRGAHDHGRRVAVEALESSLEEALIEPRHVASDDDLGSRRFAEASFDGGFEALAKGPAGLAKPLGIDGDLAEWRRRTGHEAHACRPPGLEGAFETSVAEAVLETDRGGVEEWMAPGVCPRTEGEDDEGRRRAPRHRVSV